VEPKSVREGTGAAASEPGPLHPPRSGARTPGRCIRSGAHDANRSYCPTALLPGLAGLEEPDCPACATGWHSRCCHPDLAEDGDGELVERCCDGQLIARRRRPLWTR
jgi:hypothetical protein